MTLDKPDQAPEINETFTQVVEALSKLADGAFTSKGGECLIWTTQARLAASGRALFFKYSGLYDSFSLRINGMTFTLSGTNRGGEFRIDAAKNPDAALSALKVLLGELNTAVPRPEVASVSTSLETRVNNLLAEEGKDPYTGSPEVNHFYKRP